jgi:hypothetical protein
MLRFDEDLLRRKLLRLGKVQRLVFAVACAERAFGPYRYYARQARRGRPRLLRATLNSLWSSAIQQRLGHKEPFLDIGSDLIPLSCMQADEEIEQRALYKKPHDLDCIADDAVCTLFYACKCELRGNIKYAIWAALCDYNLVSESIVDLDKRASRRIYRIHARRPKISELDLVNQIDYVQEELQEQISDLEELSSSKEHGTFSEVVQHVRHRAQRRAEVLRQIVKRIYEEQWLRPKSSHK